MQACKHWRTWVGNSEEHPLVATLVSGLIVSRESTPASSFPHTSNILFVPTSSLRSSFCLRCILRLQLPTQPPPTYSLSPFLWHRPLEPTSNPLRTQRRYSRSRFCVTWVWGELSGGWNTKKQTCPVLACLSPCLALTSLCSTLQLASAASSSRYPRCRCCWKGVVK